MGKLLNGLSFSILGGNKVLQAMMQSQGAVATGISRADFVIFMGGADISSTLYNEPPHHHTQSPNLDRDRTEIAIFKTTPTQFRVGICRGAQLLHVLNGGKLWQHTEGHGKTHELRYTSEKDITRVYTVSSTHHQMMRMPAIDGKVWGTANETTHRQLVTGADFAMSDCHWSDPEIVHYPKTLSLCFQPHPEHLHPKDTRELFYRCLRRMIET